MKELVELEMKKINIKIIMRWGMVTSGVLLLYLIMSTIIFRSAKLSAAESLYRIITCNKIVYTIYIGILINVMFSEEIFSKSFSILFTYPISRMKLLAAKIILILIIAIPFMYGSILLHFIILSILNAAFHFMEGALTGGMVAGIIFSGLFQTILASLTALIPLFPAVKYASPQYTLMVSGVLAFFLYNICEASFFGPALLIMLVTAALGVVITKYSLGFIGEKDIM